MKEGRAKVNAAPALRARGAAPHEEVTGLLGGGPVRLYMKGRAEEEVT